MQTIAHVIHKNHHGKTVVIGKVERATTGRLVSFALRSKHMVNTQPLLLDIHAAIHAAVERVIEDYHLNGIDSPGGVVKFIATKGQPEYGIVKGRIYAVRSISQLGREHSNSTAFLIEVAHNRDLLFYAHASYLKRREIRLHRGNPTKFIRGIILTGADAPGSMT